ncbi:MAG: NADH:ubiquinone reductase (Na(+)-transporting) subunit C, partial [Lentisphaeraceae bacterium]|nr:NADH:ubiquinone reductase (Na(+)-transporting) subunit C [Lentisphaeraceae bacterium]
AATKLKPLQEKNADVDKKSKIILAVGEFDPKAKKTDEAYRSSEDVLKYFGKEGFKDKFIVKFAVNHEGGVVDGLSDVELKLLDLENQIKKFSDEEADKRKYPIYAFYGSKADFDAKKATTFVIPVYGYGLWSNCYGVLALNSTGDTVENLVYYKHGETPGLGGEIEKDYFTDPFKGKKVFNAKGEVALKTTKGELNENTVPAVSGATFTMDGVDNMLKKFLTIYDKFFQTKRGGAQ